MRYVLSKDGKTQNSYQYGAFGEAILTEESVPNRLRYNAQIEDDLTGLYYLRARYYNSTTGRFTQEDVIYNDGLNLYVYCNSNPVMYCDPSGYSGEEICGPMYEELKKAYETNPAWNANPDNFTVVQGEELAKMRAEYNTMVQNGELPAGHHIQGLADGGSNTVDNIRITGERFINREDLPPAAVEYYDKYYATKTTPHPQRIAIYEENGLVSFGKNPNHTDVTNRQNDLHRWQRQEGLRTESSKKTKRISCDKKRG